jgi:hypothetical protein
MIKADGIRVEISGTGAELGCELLAVVNDIFSSLKKIGMPADISREFVLHCVNTALLSEEEAKVKSYELLGLKANASEEEFMEAAKREIEEIGKHAN